MIHSYGNKQDSIEHIKSEIDKKWMIEQLKKGTKRFNFIIDESKVKGDDWMPTPHGWTLAEAIHFNKSLNTLFNNKDVLELGAGVGNHTVLIAKQNPKSLSVTEIKPSRFEITKSTMQLNQNTITDFDVKSFGFLFFIFIIIIILFVSD